jgi:alkylation response protein AidB-like acyl-CoA dehydrogenase
MPHAGVSAPVEPEGSDAEAVDLLLPEVRRFLAREVHSEAIDSDGAIPPAVRSGAADLGLFGLTIPETYGGAGLALGAASRVVTEIARVDRSTAIMIGLHVGLGTRGVVTHGSEALRSAWLPRLASGECIASFCATEASSGSDLTSLATVGTAVADGLRVDGEKSYVTNGGFAGLFTALIRTPGIGGARACSVVCIPRDTPGVQIGREENKLGIRGSSTVTVTFDGVVVPWSHVLGEPGRGTDLTNGLLAWGRTLMSAGCVGTARAALDASLAHVTTRRQFGRSIGELGATRAHMAWMAARVHAMESIVRAVASEEARGLPIETSSAIAKVFTSEAAFAVSDRAIQLHGALGFLEPTGVARLLRDCRVTRIFEGANDVLLVRIGAARLASRGVTVRVPESPELEALARRLERAVADIRQRLGIAAVKRQLVLQRLASAEIALVVGQASVSTEARLSQYAGAVLAEEGHLALDALSRAEADEDAATEIAKRLY